MKAFEIKIGQKIYYRGDMSNQEGIGEVTEIKITKWGETFSTKLEDGRVQNNIPCLMLDNVDTGNGHTRFCTLEAYEKRRAEKIKRFLSLNDKVSNS